MSRPRDERGKTHFAASTKEVDSTSARLRSMDLDKPDTKRFDLGSPVSPLRPSRGAPAFPNTSSSSNSSGGSVGARKEPARRSDADRSHSGELSVSFGSGSAETAGSRPSRPGHRRAGSGPLLYSGSSGSSANSPATGVLPAGNICPSGKIGKTGMMCRTTARSDVLGTGTVNYGHGSIVRGVAKGGPDAGTDAVRRAMVSSDVEEVKRVGNELYRKGQFGEALKLYDRTIVMCPDSAACRSNRAAALMAMGRLAEATKEWEAALRSDPGYNRARQRLASLYLRLGFVEDARKHMYWAGEVPDSLESQKLHSMERHLRGCSDARKSGDWNSLLKESAEAIGAGADSSIQLLASRAEAFFRLHRLEEAENALSSASRLEASVPTNSTSRFCGMTWNSYLYVVKAQIEMALGRFESAESTVEKACGLDPQNREVAMARSDVKLVMRARARGNELFNSGKFADACFAYGEGLRFDPCNSVLYCNRAACHSKLGQWQKAIEDCNEALKVQPNYIKALLRRAASYEKLEKWAEVVSDYSTLRKQLPHDNNVSNDVAEALLHAQVALKGSRGEQVSNLTSGGEVEEIVGVDQFRSAISLPGISIIFFMAPQNQQCLQIAPFVDTLCSKYPTIHFHKVNTLESEGVAKLENVRTLPTFKFYKSGAKIKDMICPSQQLLEYSLRHYAL